MKKNISFIILIFLTFHALGSPYWLKDPKLDDYLDSWIGINSDELIKNFGPADSISILSDGSKVMKYEKKTVITIDPTYKKGVKKTYTKKDEYLRQYTETIDTSEYNPGSSHEYNGHVLFTVNSKNIITDYRYDGDLFALEKLITKTTSPFYNINSFYLAQYNEKANIEWNGKLIDDLKLLYNQKKTQKKNLILEENIGNNTSYVTCYQDGIITSGIKYYYNSITKEITEVVVFGEYIDIEYLFFYYNDFIPIKNKNPFSTDTNIIIGLSYGTDNTFGICYNCTGSIYNDNPKIKASAGFNFYFDKNFDCKDLNVNLFNLYYNFIDKNIFTLYTGVGIDLGWNFGSKDHGFNLGFPITLGTTINSVGIEGTLRPGCFTEKKFFWKLQLFYTFDIP